MFAFVVLKKIKMAEGIEIISTGDGSSSLYNAALDETYHSTKGALTESQYVYIDKGVEYLKQKGSREFEILEIGFGTGLNAILTYMYKLQYPELEFNYTTIEKYPLTPETIQQLTYNGISDNENIAEVYNAMHTCSWGNSYKLEEGFTFTKLQQDINTINNSAQYNLVYYDAFAPSKQPEMWTMEVLEKIKQSMQVGGVLVTYCAQGQFKRNLKALGFELDIIEGPMGKKEMTRATLRG